MLVRRKLKSAPHFLALKENMKEVKRLIEIHAEIAGNKPGRKMNVQVLNKSAIVLVLACWEAYIEDLATAYFMKMLELSSSPADFPDYVKHRIAKEVKAADVWEIAGDGWRNVFIKYHNKILDDRIRLNSFNTPSETNINELLNELIGLPSISKGWKWRNQTKERSSTKLAELIKLRGNIAHRVSTDKNVTKKMVTDYVEFISRLAVVTHNRALTHLKTKTQHQPWRRMRRGSTT